ncbi:MAG: MarR family transcriptional regulator [Massilia sp.]|nr:MarR family transcriptional regulator [Massilia sp.]
MDISDDTLMALTMTLTHVARSYKAAADKMAANFGLSHATAWPIVMIGRLGDGVRPGTVADALGLEPPSLVRVIDQLVDAGLVERQDDPSDRRARTLHLSAKGRTCADGLEAALIPFRRQLFGNLDPADIAACARVLAGLDATLANASPGGAGRAHATRKVS